MCQRRQKSVIEVAEYGASKFCGNVNPSSSAIPIAMFVYPKKSDLHRVGVDADEHLERRVLVGRAEHLVHDVGGEVVRDHHLHEQPRADQEERARSVHIARIAGRRDLRDELARSHDRAGDEMREEGQVRGEGPEADRHEVAPVHVDEVADPHEREEGDADREHDRPRRERDVEAREGEQVVRRGDEEVVVLEVAEEPEVSGEGDCEQGLPVSHVAASVDAERERVVPDDRECEEEAEPPVPGAVEDEARGDDEGPPPLSSWLEEPRQR
jgi:hypothetical protein